MSKKIQKTGFLVRQTVTLAEMVLEKMKMIFGQLVEFLLTSSQIGHGIAIASIFIL